MNRPGTRMTVVNIYCDSYLSRRTMFQELSNRGEESVRLLNESEMTAMFEHHEPCLWRVLRELYR
jgi:hypothetical protein